MSNRFRFLQTLRWAALAGVLSGAVAAHAASVGFSATGSTGVAGGSAFAEIVYDFDGPYPLLSLDLEVEWDPSRLSYDAANTTVSYAAVTTQLDTLIAALNTPPDSVLLNVLPNGLDISAFFLSVPQLDGEVTVRIAFSIAADAPAGPTLVSFAGGTANDETGDEASFSRLLATIGISRDNGTPLTLPGSAALIVGAALAALAVTRRKRPPAFDRGVPAPVTA